MVGGVSGIFGILSVPPDLMVMTYLQLQLLVEIATLYKVNLKTERARGELLDVYGYANGIGPLQRASPKVVAKLASLALAKGGLELAPQQTRALRKQHSMKLITTRRYHAGRHTIDLRVNGETVASAAFDLH